METAKTYSLFLLITSAVALGVYLLMKEIAGTAGPYFLLTAMGQAHFIMGYTWSVPAYQRMPRAIMLRNLAVFSFAGLVLLYMFYLSGLFDRNEVWMMVIVLAVLHFARDYKYFLNQIQSGFVNHTRSFAWTIFLSSLFFLVFFGLLFRDPGQQYALFFPDAPLPVAWYQMVWYASIAAAGASAFFLIKSSARATLPHTLFSLGAVAIPGTTVNIIPSLTLLDMILFVAFWHLVQWDAYMLMKIYRRTQEKRVPPEGKGLFSKILLFWGRSVPHYIMVTLLYDVLLLGPFFAMVLFGAYSNFSTAVQQSFFWGLAGYALFSPLHFLFSALLAYSNKQIKAFSGRP